MTNALNMAQPGMWRAAYADSADAWQILSRHMAMLQVIDEHPPLAALLDEAMMALADGVPAGPFTAAADVLHMARQRAAAQRQAEGRPDGEGRHGAPAAQFTPNGGHPATSAQVTQ